jgi:hypothetical protein
MEQRAKVAGKTSEAAIYRKFINSMKEKTKEMNEEDLRDWFGKSKSKDVNIDEAGSLHHWFQGSSGITKSGKRVKGWVQADGSPCANEPGETKTPKCFSSARLAALRRKGKRGESIIQSAVRRKRKKDSKQPEKFGAAKPTNVPTFAKGRKSKDYVKPEPGLKETMEIQEAQKDRPGKGSGTKDACYHKVKSRYRVWPSAYASGALVKCRRVGADNWGNKSEEREISLVEKILGEEMCGKGMYWCNTNKECKPLPKGFDIPGQSIKPTEVGIGKPVAEEKSCNHTKKGKNCPIHGTDDCSMKESKDHEYSMARSELETISNAVKRLQKKMKGEGNIEAWVQSKITKAADYIDTAADYVDSGEHNVDEACWKGYKKKGMKTMFGKKYPNCVKAEDFTIDESVRIPAKIGNIVSVMFNWRGKTYGTKMFFPQTSLPSRKDVEYEIQKVYPDCRILSYKISDFVPGQPLIYVNKSMNEMIEMKEDWQSINRKDKTDGLSQAAVDAYRKENPGSKLQTAVTEKKPKGKRAKRRLNFCRRMKGMKSKLTSEKTARDPDSRINKALRRWNCN